MRLSRPLAVPAALLLTFAALAQDKPAPITDPAKADADFAVLGEYVGEVKGDDGKPAKLGVQVAVNGTGKFRTSAFRGGLPGDGWDKSKKIDGDGQTKDGVTAFPKLLDGASIKDGVLSLVAADGSKLGDLKKVTRQSSTLGAKPPEGAVVIFDGSSLDKLTGGKLVEDKLLLSGARTKQSFKDFTLHLEYRVPYRCPANGNSGVYLQGLYEIQIIDWFGRDPGKGGNGAIYGVRAPDVNVSYPPLSWQTFDIRFTAAKFADDGSVAKNPVVTVRHNGVVIHENVELPGKGTDGGKLATTGGPIFLQPYGGSPVHFRNVWIVEKD